MQLVTTIGITLWLLACGHPLAGGAPPEPKYRSSDLCFLSHGGSSETFTINEAVPVNSVIGTLKVIGNVSSGDGTLGDIELSLAPNHPKSRLEGLQEVPIKIEPHSKRLVLVRALDKEGPEGESGLVVGVKCRKANQVNEPSIIIPVRLIVTDSNDHAPTFIGAPYEANVSEVAPVGSPLLPPNTIKAHDDDQQGPFSTIEYYVEPGPFSHMAKFESQFGGSLLLTAPLDYETLPKFWITIRAQDQGEPANSASTTITINVLDADDQNPRFTDDKYTATLPDLNRAGEQLNVAPRQIRASDPDTAINSPIEYSFSSGADSREQSFFSIDPKYGHVSLKKPLPAGIDLPLTLVVKATQADNRDRYALTTLTVTSKRHVHLPDIRFLQSNYSVTLPENIPAGHVALTVQTTRNFNSDKKLLSGEDPGISFQILDDDQSQFSIRANGEIVVAKPLDYETAKYRSFRVMVSDGKQSDVARVNVTLVNVNDCDPLFSQSHYAFFVSESRLKSNAVIGEIKATDADVGDSVSLSIRGPFARVFAISDDGMLRIKSLKMLNTSQCHLIVVATDSGSPPRSSSVPVTVQFAPGILKSFGRSLDEMDKFIAGGGAGTIASGSDVDVNMLLSASSSSAIVLVIVLGVLLATLFIIIITLTVHVLKQRKFPGSSGSGSSDSSGSGSTSPTGVGQYQQYQFQGPARRSSAICSSLAGGKSSTNRVGPLHEDRDSSGSSFGRSGVERENPIFSLDSGTSTTSNLSSRYYNTPISTSVTAVTAGIGNNGSKNIGTGGHHSDPDSAVSSYASSSEYNNKQRNDDLTEVNRASSRQSSHGSASPPPPPSQTLSNDLTNGLSSRISVVKWPAGSIPRRVKPIQVKKLTWEDEIGFARSNCQSQGQAATNSNQSGDSQEAGSRPATHTLVGLSSLADHHHSRLAGLPVVASSSPIGFRHTELDPDVSVAPLRRSFNNSQTGSSSGLADLTVYF